MTKPVNSLGPKDGAQWVSTTAPRSPLPRPAGVQDPNATAPLGVGLTHKAPEVAAIAALPPGIKCVRAATPADVEAIAAIEDRYEYRKIDASDHPANGWLVQKASAKAIEYAMQTHKDFWVAESDDGKIVAFQAVSPPRFISRPAAKHRFFGPFESRAYRAIERGEFIYMSQIATIPEYRGRGLAAALQRRVLEHYDPKLPLVAHVAVFTQDDFDAWDGNPNTFNPHSNNVASHRYHQKHGYVPVAWTSDLAARGSTQREEDPRFNSGLAPPKPGSDGPPAVLGVLYVNFRDGRENVPHEYIDPVKAVMESPLPPDARDRGEWRNPFNLNWPRDIEPDLFEYDEGFLSHSIYWRLYDYWRDRVHEELAAIRARRS